MAAAAQAAGQQQPDGSSSPAAKGRDSNDDAISDSSPRRPGRPSIISRDSEKDIVAARQRLQAYLQQQGGISGAQAAELAGELSVKLGAAVDQLAPPPLQWFSNRGMQIVKAAQLLACIHDRDASYIRQWPTWQPVFEATWQLADSYLAAYQQQCKAAKQRPLKGSRSMAVMLSSPPARYQLLRAADFPSKLMLVQQQLGLTDAEVGQLVAAGLDCTGSKTTTAATLQWLVSFAGSREAATSMLRGAPSLLNCPAATLDNKAAALQAAWAGTLQLEQVRQLVQQFPAVLMNDSCRYAPSADVLRSWFLQPRELLAMLRKAPKLLAAPGASLQANERWMTGPPLSLSRQQFLALVAAGHKRS